MDKFVVRGGNPLESLAQILAKPANDASGALLELAALNALLRREQKFVVFSVEVDCRSGVC